MLRSDHLVEWVQCELATLVDAAREAADLHAALIEALDQWQAWHERRYGSHLDRELEPQLGRIAKLRKRFTPDARCGVPVVR